MLALQTEAFLKNALLEDLAQGDVTTQGLANFLEGKTVKMSVKTRENCIVSGLNLMPDLCFMLDKALLFETKLKEGDWISKNQVIATLSGPAAAVLQVERTLLNLLQHLCGVATLTNAFVKAVEGTGCSITHTRKTLPGLRLIQQQAVLAGGGKPHRYNLGSAAMLKDNHLLAAGVSIMQAVRGVRAAIGHTQRLEVEADTLEQAREAVAAGADVVLLDNFSLEELQNAVSELKGKAILEASGGINLGNVKAYALTGVDVISTSQLTMGAPPIDIGLDD